MIASAVIIAALLAACTAETPADKAPVVSPPDAPRGAVTETSTDSAPTRVLPLDSAPEVDTSAPAPASLQTVHVITESGDGPLANIVGGAFTERELVLAEASTARLHFYDRETGDFVRSVGRRGSGPGEFQRLEWVQRRGDQLYAHDRELRRLSVFALDGTFQRTLTLQAEDGARQPTAVAVFADGSILGARVIPEEGVSAQGVLLPTVPSVMAVRYMLARHAPDGALLTTLVPYRGSESFVAPNSGGGATSGPALFGRHGAAVTADSTLVVTSSDADSIVQYTPDGARLRTLRPPPSRAVAVRASDVARERERLVPKGPAPFDIGKVFDQQTPPEQFPAFGWARGRRLSPLTSASDGSLWVLRYGGVRSKATVYLRFAPNGQLLDSLRTPDEAVVLDASGAMLLLGTLDGDGADRVLLLRRARIN